MFLSNYESTENEEKKLRACERYQIKWFVDNCNDIISISLLLLLLFSPLRWAIYAENGLLYFS